MYNFMNESNTVQYILEQPLWLNKHFMINNNCTYQKAWKKAGILYINDIINKTNGYFMSHDENSNITTNHIVTLQIHSSIPNNWTKNSRRKIFSTPLDIQNSIFIYKSKLNVEKVKCKEYHWHIINTFSHLPKAISPWEDIYIYFKSNDNDNDNDNISFDHNIQIEIIM